jgi:hypothetical protein
LCLGSSASMGDLQLTTQIEHASLEINVIPKIARKRLY